MARSDHIVSLVRAGVAGDKTTLRSTVEAMMAEERARSHHSVADRLEKALHAVAVTPPPLITSRGPGSDGKDLILESNPQVQLDQLLLTLPARREADQIIEEHIRADVLRANGYEPRHRILLSGPPGNGKTSYAEAIAEALALPFLVVRYDALIGSYLGETNTRLRKLFDYVRTRPCVLFFDEFDSIGKERGDEHETGEIKRVVSFLLLQIDQLPSYVVTIAATNHAELLDRAVWRRFQSKIAFPQPTRTEVAAFMERIFLSWPQAPKMKPSTLSNKLQASSYAEARDFCQNVRRRNILGLGEADIDSSINAELELWGARVIPDRVDGNRSNQTTPSTGRGRATTKTPRKRG
ncbi:ATP-dependent zinc metalloprotease FtsH [Asticcacaulis sp. MM231]